MSPPLIKVVSSILLGHFGKFDKQEVEFLRIYKGLSAFPLLIRSSQFILRKTEGLNR